MQYIQSCKLAGPGKLYPCLFRHWSAYRSKFLVALEIEKRSAPMSHDELVEQIWAYGAALTVRFLGKIVASFRVIFVKESALNTKLLAT